MIEIRKNVNFDHLVQVESLHGVTFSNENKGHKFVISCMRGGELLTLTGTVTARFMRSNNTTILIAGNDYTGIVDGKAFVSLPQDCYNVPGRFQMAIFLSDSGTTNCIYACVGSVQRSEEGTLIDSGEAVPSLDELLAKIEACEQATADATSAASAANSAAESASTAGDSKFIRYDTVQSLTANQQAQARANIGASTGAVLYSESQALTDAQKTVARNNTGAASATDVDALKSAIGYEATMVTVPVAISQGGFTGNVGEEITFITPTAWRRASFVPDSGKTYHITFTSRENISTRYYVYGVDADGIILGRYAEIAQSSTRETKEFDLSFDSAIKTVWVCGSGASGVQPITVSYAAIITRFDSLETDVNALKEAVFPGTSVFDKGPFNTFRQDFTDYYTGKNSDYSEFDSSTTYSDVITAFDALMALDSVHITKKSLGVASGTDAGGNQYTIYEYAFTPYAYTNVNLAGFAKNPTILMDGSIHGFEKNSTYAIYYFLRDVILNFHDDPVLTAIRNNVVLKIVPVTNPYGFDRGLYYNANSVNINRNFYTSDWSSVTDSQTGNSGLEAFDQPESKIIRDWVLDNLSGITCYYNVHTNGRVVHSYGDMNACMPKFERTDSDTFFGRLKYVIKRHIQRQTAYIPKTYDLDVLLNEFVGKYQKETGSFGTAAVWAAEQAKIVSMTLELFVGVTVNQVVIIEQYADESKKICSEMLGNMIAETIFEYSE